MVNNEQFFCKVCQSSFPMMKPLCTHLQMKHGLSAKDYAIQYLCDGKRPVCPICQKETKYIRLSFNKYCKDHCKLAMSEAGKIGRQMIGEWNKGLTKDDHPSLLEYSKRMTGKDNHFYGKKHSEESIKKMKLSSMISEKEFNERLEERSNDFEFFTTYDEYFSRQKQKIKTKCKLCGNIEGKTLLALERGSQCHLCFPIPTNSQEQKEVFDFVSDLLKNDETVAKNSKKIIPPKELDIFVEGYNFAIEYNGLYWHSEFFKNEKDHYEKFLECQKNGISLFHIFSDEWKNKQDIIKSMIEYRFGKIQTKIPANKCELRVIEKNGDMEVFFEENHVGGHVRSKIAFGLFYNEELIQCVSLRKPMHKSLYKDSIEIARSATKKYTVVQGGLSKLFKKIKEYAIENQYRNILCYCDLRYGTSGKGYEILGFSNEGHTGIDYWYTDDYARYDRFKYRAQNGISEKEVAKNAGVKKIFGCGSYRFIYDLTSCYLP